MTARLALAAGCAAVALFAIVLFSGVTDNEFIWDDPIIFERQLPYFDSLDNVLHPPKSIPQFGVHYYRPVTVLSFLLDEWIAGKIKPPEERNEARRLVYHTSVVVYHAIFSALILLLGLGLARRAGLEGVPAAVAAGVGALLFAAHPIHVEVVAWMAGRTDVLCGIFFVGALLAFIAAREASGRRAIALSVLAALCALASMMAKESGAGVLLVLGLAELVLPARIARRVAPEPALSRAERRRRERAPRGPAPGAGSPATLLVLRWALLIVVTLYYFGMRNAALGTPTSPAPGTGIPFLRAVFGSLGWYIWKFFWPPPQSAFVAGIPGGWQTILGLVAAAAFAAAIVTVLRSGKERRWAPELLAAGIFFGGIAPPLAIALRKISETPLAERYLYIPSAGGCVLAGLLLGRLARRLEAQGQALAIVAPALVLLALLVPAGRQSVRRAEVWQDNMTFWADAIAKAPDQGLPHLHLGIEYNNHGERERAIAEYELAFAKYDDAEGRSKALNNWGSALLGLGRYEEAIDKFKRALKEVANYPTPHYNWAIALENLARAAKDPGEKRRLMAEARAHYERALAINPRYTKAHVQYGSLLAQLGDLAGARRHLRRVLQLAPTSSSARRAQRMLETIDRVEKRRREAAGG